MTKTIEKIHERALRYEFNDYNSNYSEHLEKSKMPSLKNMRLRTMVLDTYKIWNKQGQQYLHDLIVFFLLLLFVLVLNAN